MTLHPKERGGHTRRDLLARAGGAALGLSSAGSLLAACSNSTAPGGASGGSTGTELLGPGGLPLARPDKRVTMPLWEKPIASGLQPETGGSFEIFNYPDYLYPKLFKEFCAKYNVTPVYTPFDNIASGIQRLASRSGSLQGRELRLRVARRFLSRAHVLIRRELQIEPLLRLLQISGRYFRGVLRLLQLQLGRRARLDFS